MVLAFLHQATFCISFTCCNETGILHCLRLSYPLEGLLGNGGPILLAKLDSLRNMGAVHQLHGANKSR